MGKRKGARSVADKPLSGHASHPARKPAPCGCGFLACSADQDNVPGSINVPLLIREFSVSAPVPTALRVILN